LRREEAQRLIAALPEHLAAMASFSLSTGLRAANATGLQWTQVDLVRRVAWIHPDQAKAGARYRCRSTTTPCNIAPAPREASTVCVQLSRKAHHAGQHEGVVRGAGEGRHRGLSLARSAPQPGRAGTCRQVRHSLRCRKWAAGRARRWCGGMRISPPITCRRTLRSCAAR
jgi:integrase